MRRIQLPGRGDTPRSRHGRSGAALLALAIATQAWAGQVTSPFAVRVDLINSGACATATDPPRASVVIDCQAKPVDPVVSTPPRMAAQTFRFHIPTGDGDVRYGNVDLYAGAGTITSWRVIHLAGWDYLEMTVGW